MAESATAAYQRQMKFTAILLVLAVLSSRTACALDVIEGPTRVIDGDTIEIDEERIRLWGIDAPELSQFCTEDGTHYPCGLDASQALRKQIGRTPPVMAVLR